MGNQKETRKNPQYKYASTREKLCFGIGAIGKDAICNLVGAFLMLYFTDTLYLAPAFVGVLFFVARIWDAINDPMMGMIVDNTHTRFGKFRIWSWLPNLTNDPHEREKVSVIPRFFASLAGFSVATFGLYIINYLNKVAGESNLYAEKGYTLFAIIIAVIFIVTIGITVFNVKEESTLGVSSEKTSLKQAFQVIVKNDQLLAFIGLLLTFNLCTQLAKSFAVYYFKCVCHDEYLYSIFGFAIIAEMAGLLFFPKIAEKISREKVYAFACGLPIVGFVLLGAAGYVAPQSKVLVIVCCALLFFGSGLSLGVTTCCMADVIDYGEVKFGVRNESVTCSAQTFLMKAAMAAAGGLTGIGLQIVGYNAKAVTQSAATVMGIRVLMIVIPIILAFASFGIYKKYYTLKGEKMEEITRKVNEMHAKKQTA